jgi:serine/threonine protein kinase
MKATLGTLSLDTKFTGQYRSLFRKLGLLTLLLVALITSMVVYFDERLVRELSSKLIASTAETVKVELIAFFNSVESNMRTAIEQLQMTDEDDDELMKKLFHRLSPFLSQYQNSSGIIVAEVGTGKEYLILKPKPTEANFLVRHHLLDDLGENRLRFERWRDGEIVEDWIREIEYDPKTRDWYINALAAKEHEIVGTQPYTFFTLKKPGITLSSRWHKRDSGRHYITAFDILLSNVSRITQAMRPTENGVVFVFTPDKRLVGLPANERFHDEQAVDAALLEPIDDSGLPIVQAAVAEWERKGRTRETFSFDVNGQTWWAGFEIDENVPEDERFWGGILVPESDFLGSLLWQRNIALAVVIGLGLLLAAVQILKAVRKIRRDVREAVSRIGQKLGAFELLYKIGDGGNGAVYRAKHALLRRPTAVKVMRAEFALSESAKRRFEHEVQITSSLTHPNTVAVYDFGETPEGTLYYAMEYLSGVTLQDLVPISGPQTAARVLRILHQVCGSLAEAHGQGLIHRDIKPSNIMLCERGGLNDVVKVLDFGLVKDIQQEAPELTQVNTLVGTPLYMAPEIIADASGFSPLSDLYALGAVGYYLLTGRNVFEGASAVEICAMHLHDEPVPPSQRAGREIPGDLEAIVMACLAKNPEERPESAEIMSAMLARCEDFGAWTWEQARQWWSDHRDTLPMDEQEGTHEPLSNTHVLLDIGEQLRHQGVTEPKA